MPDETRTTAPPFVDADTWRDETWMDDGRWVEGPRGHPYGAEAFQIVTPDRRRLIFPNKQDAMAWEQGNVGS
jgi:hypothetical protein